MLNLFLDRMKPILGEDYDAFVKSLNDPQKQSLHVNILKDPSHTIPNSFHLMRHPYVENGYYFEKETHPMGKYSYHAAGLYYIQEPSAMLVGSLAPLKKGMRVLDMCAAPGGKSSSIAMRIGSEGLLVTNDITPNRAAILSENMERCGFTNTVVINTDPCKLPSLLPGFFNMVFIDAPCSGEGMFRKLDQAKTTWSESKVYECAHIQKNLIQAAYDLLADDGIIVYSTCTYELEENEYQIQLALDTLDLELIPFDLKPGFTPGIGLPETIRLYPHRFNGEGHYIALLRKTGHTPSGNVQSLKSNLTKEQQKLVNEFYQSTMNCDIPSFLYASNNHIYAVPYPYIDFKKTRVLRNGLYLGECKKNRFEPSHSMALAYAPSAFKRTYNFTYNCVEIEKYLHGETLEGHQGNGFGLITIDGFGLGLVKEVQGVLKNFYPKGLRR